MTYSRSIDKDLLDTGTSDEQYTQHTSTYAAPADAAFISTTSISERPPYTDTSIFSVTFYERVYKPISRIVTYTSFGMGPVSPC